MPSQPSISERLHAVAIHLLRKVRLQDAATGLSPARLSALSVIVYAGPITLTGLAEAEQVKPPTMTRLVQALEGDGLVTRVADKKDKRASQIKASRRGRNLLEKGRLKRLEALSQLLGDCSKEEEETLKRAVHLLERVLAKKARFHNESRKKTHFDEV